MLDIFFKLTERRSRIRGTLEVGYKINTIVDVQEDKRNAIARIVGFRGLFVHQVL